MTISPKEVRQIRDSLNMTQRQFAKVMKVDQNCISRWERGARTPRKNAEKHLRRLDGRSQ